MLLGLDLLKNYIFGNRNKTGYLWTFCCVSPPGDLRAMRRPVLEGVTLVSFPLGVSRAGHGSHRTRRMDPGVLLGSWMMGAFVFRGAMVRLVLVLRGGGVVWTLLTPPGALAQENGNDEYLVHQVIRGWERNQNKKARGERDGEMWEDTRKNQQPLPIRQWASKELNKIVNLVRAGQFFQFLFTGMWCFAAILNKILVNVTFWQYAKDNMIIWQWKGKQTPQCYEMRVEIF